MEIYVLITIPILFFISLYILVYKKDEKFLVSLEDRTRTQQAEIRRLQMQMESIHNKLQSIDHFCQALKIDFADKKVFNDEQTPVSIAGNVNRAQDDSLAKLQNDISTIKEILNLDESDLF